MKISRLIVDLNSGITRVAGAEGVEPTPDSFKDWCSAIKLRPNNPGRFLVTGMHDAPYPLWVTPSASWVYSGASRYITR